MNSDIRQLLEAVKSGETTVEDALLEIKKAPFEDIGYAKVDLHRKIRQGAAEVIYGAGKTPEQIAGIIETMLKNGQERILITRMSAEAAAYVGQLVDLNYHAEAGVGIVGTMPVPNGIGKIVIATGGTSDISVAEEAALTAEILGNQVVRLYDVGVSGVHRLHSAPDPAGGRHTPRSSADRRWHCGCQKHTHPHTPHHRGSCRRSDRCRSMQRTG